MGVVGGDRGSVDRLGMSSSETQMSVVIGHHARMGMWRPGTHQCDEAQTCEESIHIRELARSRKIAQPTGRSSAR